MVNTARNTYVNPGSVAQFDFHQSDKSKVSFPLLSFLSSNDSDGTSQSLVLHDFGFHHLNLRTNLRVLIELEFLEPIDVRLRDLVAQDILSPTLVSSDMDIHFVTHPPLLLVMESTFLVPHTSLFLFSVTRLYHNS